MAPNLAKWGKAGLQKAAEKHGEKPLERAEIDLAMAGTRVMQLESSYRVASRRYRARATMTDREGRLRQLCSASGRLCRQATDAFPAVSSTPQSAQ
jgi:hypothetical protein